MVTDSDFHTLIATLKRALDLRLTKSQRTKLKALCQEIAGVEAESGIPKEEADAKRAAIERAKAAEQRVKELEAKLAEALEQRSWWRR